MKSRQACMECTEEENILDKKRAEYSDDILIENDQIQDALRGSAETRGVTKFFRTAPPLTFGVCTLDFNCALRIEQMDP